MLVFYFYLVCARFGDSLAFCSSILERHARWVVPTWVLAGGAIDGWFVHTGRSFRIPSLEVIIIAIQTTSADFFNGNNC